MPAFTRRSGDARVSASAQTGSTRCHRTIDAVTDTDPASRPSREVVGIFSRPAPLESCIKDLLKAGFEHQDLSVLSSHDAIEAIDADGYSWRDRLLPLLSENRYEVPLVAGAVIALSSGPVGAAIAGLTAAGVGAAALKEIFDEVVSLPDTEEFAEAVKAGEIVLWAAAPTPEREAEAREILARHDARNIHLHETPTPTDED